MNYEEIKRQDMAKAEAIVENINRCKSKYVRYLDSRPITDLKHMINTSCALYKDNVAFRQKFDRKGDFECITYGQALEDINALGTALIDAGFKDKRIAVSGANGYYWAISYLAVVCGVGVVVPLDKELSEDELAQLTKIAKADLVLCSNNMKDKFSKIKKYTFEEDLKDLIEKGKKLLEKGDRRYLDAEVYRDEMSILLFTSGTTGISKGVMLSHGNIVEDLMASPTVLKVNQWDIFFSVLPLHHTYECTCGFLMPLYKGASIAYCQGLKYIQKNLQEVKPTMFLAVPAIFELLNKKIWQGIRAKGKEKQVRRLMALNRASHGMLNSAFKDITSVFGGNMRMLIVGGAAINPDILQDFRDFGIMAVQGYGLTECAPMGALTPDHYPKNTSVGRAFPGFDAKIIDKDENGTGEICLKGGNVMLGYYNDPEATKEVIDEEGWFHTGDLGYIDREKYIYITGRKKNVIITKNGKNVFPEELEYYLSNVPYVAESMVFAVDAKGGEDITIVASIYPDKEALGKDMSKEEILELMWNEVDKINEKVPFFKKIKKIVIRDTEFDKNTSKKIKRFSEENKRIDF
ncbi:MAG: AMP-binding protein [Clostridia bacterium]|nr:AMP-binding protein [Clostridia bacterium]